MRQTSVSHATVTDAAPDQHCVMIRKGTGFQVFGVVFNLQTWGKGVSVAFSVMLSIAPIILARANEIRKSGAAPCEVSDTLR